MTTIDDLLARTRLIDKPVVPHDVVPTQDTFAELDDDNRPQPAHPRSPRQHIIEAAARDLHTLCEVLVVHTAADALQEKFIAERLPAPRGARALGCILQLSQDVGSARMWWQFAAGAGDDTSSYCLYLHHLALGEVDAAAWWRKQTGVPTRRSPTTENLQVTVEDEIIDHVDRSTPTMLRVLDQLLSTTERCASEAVDAIMAFVPHAVASGQRENPDLEIPAPHAGFAEHITIVLAAATASRTPPARQQFNEENEKLERRDQRAPFWKSHGNRWVPADSVSATGKALESNGSADAPENSRVA
jgi:hypothetical protein